MCRHDMAAIIFIPSMNFSTVSANFTRLYIDLCLFDSYIIAGYSGNIIYPIFLVLSVSFKALSDK